MPLLDHFHPPLTAHRQWQGFHSAWANNIVRQLNHELLPPRYYAEPNVKIGGQIEIDVGTMQTETIARAADEGVATAVWAPPQAALVFPVDFANLDVFEVKIVHDEEGPRIVAAIELVSPANKDRPSQRRAFAMKCAAYLQQSIGVVVVDVVTSRQANLHVELLQLLELSFPKPTLGHLYAAAYRVAAPEGQSQLEVWPEPLSIGAGLPTLPLWLDDGCALPLDLEESYAETCETLRISEQPEAH